MCAVLSEHSIKISPATYYEWVDKQPSMQQWWDEEVTQLIMDVQAANRRN